MRKPVHVMICENKEAYRFYIDYAVGHGLYFPALRARPMEEHTLHELAHAILLGMDTMPMYIEEWVSARIYDMEIESADWNEIESCAVELRAAKLIGLDVGIAEHIFTEVKTAPYDIAIASINRSMWTERVYKQSLKLLKILKRDCESHIKSSMKFHPIYGYEIR